MMTRVWVGKGFNKNAKVEEHQFSDGTIHYSFRDRLGRPSDITNKEEADEIIKRWNMIEVTEQFKNDGWIL